MEEFRLLVTDSGRLQLDVLVYSTQKGDQMMTYTDSFCLDAKSKIVVFCPCTKLHCVGGVAMTVMYITHLWGNASTLGTTISASGCQILGWVTAKQSME